MRRFVVGLAAGVATAGLASPTSTALLFLGGSYLGEHAHRTGVRVFGKGFTTGILGGLAFQGFGTALVAGAAEGPVREVAERLPPPPEPLLPELPDVGPLALEAGRTLLRGIGVGLSALSFGFGVGKLTTELLAPGPSAEPAEVGVATVAGVGIRHGGVVAGITGGVLFGYWLRGQTG